MLSLDTKLRSFADDLYRDIRSIDDSEILQKHLDTLQEWES